MSKNNDYISQYKEIYKGISESNKKKAEQLIIKLSDVLIMMDECKEHIQADGCVTEMCQGNYSIERENPWSKVYDSKAKIMLSILDKLDKMLPEQKAEGITTAGENLAKFVSGGKPVELR